MAMNRRETLALHRDAILAIAEKHGATNVRIVGSIARGDDDGMSDVDLLVKFAPDRGFTDLVEFLDGVQSLVGGKVNVLTEHPMMRPRLRRNLERDAIPL
jgi:predicted nucleotidyltransferase